MMTSLEHETFMRVQNFIDINDLKFTFSKDEETGIESLKMSGIAHSLKPNKKKVIFTKGAVQFAVNHFNKEQKKRNAKTKKVWIDHAYINQFGTATPSSNIIGQVDALDEHNKGLFYEADINTLHPSQIHIALVRKDIDGVSVGVDIERDYIKCSIDGEKLFSDDCDHVWGMTYAGEEALARIERYYFDELSVTGIPADEESTTNIQFSDNIDIDKKLFKKKVGDNFSETFKSDLNQDNGEDNMTGETETPSPNSEFDGENPSLSVTANDIEGVATVEDLNSVKGEVSTMSQKMDKVLSFIENQQKEKVAQQEAEKLALVKSLLNQTDEFNEDELKTFSIETLKGLERVASRSNKDSQHETYGMTSVNHGDRYGFQDQSQELPKDVVKAWFRTKLGWNPEAPKSIQRKVRATLDGVRENDNEAFRQWMEGKYGESD